VIAKKHRVTKAKPKSHPVEVIAEPKGRRRGFLRQFLRSPGQVGAIAPSSKHLARKMVQGIDLRSASCVVEFGPGTGALTGTIFSLLGQRTKMLAIELNPHMASAFRQAHPKVKLHEGSVSDVAKFCREDGLSGEACVDVIFSGLPWAVFPEALQHEILSAAIGVLKPGGKLVTFAYHTGLLTPAGRRFAAVLPKYFKSIERSGPVLLNMPPAFVYRCTK
jgi:phospholipid N-methyltransferase